MIRPRQPGEPLRRWERPLHRFGKTRVGAWYGVKVAGRIDPYLMRLTKGRLSLTFGQPVLLLHTVGAKTGRARITPVFYIRDGDDYVIAATKGGAPEHPAWYHNVRGAQEIEVELFGKRERRTVRESEGPERDRLWSRLLTLYEGYETYDQRTERTIPVIVLSPVGGDAGDG
jgi:deazaflavin-dependent oxidoreductase (nitroreductase family)